MHAQPACQRGAERLELSAWSQELDILSAELEEVLEITPQLCVDPFLVNSKQVVGAVWSLGITNLHLNLNTA